MNTNGVVDTFTVQNTGTCNDTYQFTYSANGPISGVVLNKSSAFLAPGGSTKVVATYNTGAQGSGVLTLHAEGVTIGPDGQTASDDGWFSVTTMAVSVTPDGAVAPTRPPNAGPYSETFTVKNMTGVADTYTLSCTSSANITCGSLTPSSPLPLGPFAQQDVVVNYTVGAAGSGTLTLTASSANGNNSGWFSVSVALLAPVVTLSPYTGGSRSSDDFDVLYAHSTPAYQSMGAPRQVTLVYNSSRVRPTPIVSVNARLAQDAPISGYQLQVSRAGGPLLTLLNNTNSVYYSGLWPDSTRLAAALDANANGLTNGWHDVTVTVTVHTPSSGTNASTVTTRILVDSGGGSLFGAGWNIAGLQRVHLMPASNSAAITESDGAVSFYKRDCPTCVFVAPAGVSATLALATDPVKGTIYRRTYLDGSRVEFTSDGRMWRTISRVGIAAAEMLWTDTLLTGIKDEAGKIITLGYTGSASQSSKLQTITDPAGRVTTLWTDASGRLYKITDPDGKTTEFTYNGQLLTTVTDRSAASWDYVYDALNRLATTRAPQFRDFADVLVRPEHGAVAPGILVWQPAGPAGTTLGTKKAAVRADTVMARLTDPLGAVTRVALDRFGLATKLVDPLGQVTTITRDTLGHALTVTQPSGNSVTNTYTGYLLTQFRNNVSGQTITYSYLADNSLKEITGNISARQRFYYHDGTQGLASSLKGVYVGGSGTYAAPTGGIWALTRYPDAWNRDTLVVDGGGHSSRFEYDPLAALGNLIEFTEHRGYVTTQHNDAFGRVDSIWTPQGGPYVTTYDTLNRVLTTKNPLGHVVRNYWGALAVLPISGPAEIIELRHQDWGVLLPS